MLYFIFKARTDRIIRTCKGFSDKFDISRYCFQILCVISIVLVIFIDNIKELSSGVILYCVIIACLIYLGFLVLLRKIISRQLRTKFSLINKHKEEKGNFKCNGTVRFKRRLIFEYLYIAIFAVVFMIVLFRSVFCIIIPSQNADRINGETLPVNVKVISYVFNEDTDSLFSNNLLGYTSVSDIQQGQTASSDDVLEKQEQPISSEIILDTKFGKVAIFEEVNNKQYGDLINAEIRFSKFEPQRNPGGFDEQKYYSMRGIYLKGSVIKGSLVKTGNDTGLFYRFSYGLRTQLIKVFYQTLPVREAALMTAILLGDRSGISKEDKEMLNSAGLSHITAVSGSAVSFLIFPLKSLLKKIKASRINKTIILILFLLTFGFLTGWSASVSRALLMVFIILSAKLLGKKVIITQALSLTVFFLIVYNPVFVLDIGFWLSVCATGGIVLFSDKIKNHLVAVKSVPVIIASSLSMSLTAGVSVLPVLIWMSREISFTALISNLIAVPLVEMSLLSGVILGLTGVLFSASKILYFFAVPLKGILWVISSIASMVSSIGFLKIKLYYVTFAILLAAAGFAVFFAIKDKRIKKYVAVLSLSALALNILFSVFYIWTRPEYEVVFADVGQGDATLVVLKTGESILIDSGGARQGIGAIEGILDFYNINHPTIYIATHTHEDHCGAMVELIRRRGGKTLLVPQFTKSDTGFDKKCITTGEKHKISENKITSNAMQYYPGSSITEKNNQPLAVENKQGLFSGENDLGLILLENASAMHLNIVETGRGDVFSINKNLKLKILSPSKTDCPERKKGGNESSMVIQLVYKSHNIIIMGDATDETEKFISQSGVDLPSNIFRISHHGSPKSTNHDIIDAVNPKTSIISVGFNLYGHPSEKVIKRLHDAGSDILRTDESGAIIYKFDGDKVSYRTMIS